ncbi:sarcoplasmic calcium-binding protein isoform X2 [Rhodnius prolixus]|uniref:sarcoplasmic calcium-binding protein isoform X2 n=1 Tax=Rhodnius prolixus TaxID=13249 RepID=UPI003D18802D
MPLLNVLLRKTFTKTPQKLLNSFNFKQMTRLAVFNVSQSSKPDTKNSYDTDSDSDSEFNHRMEKGKSEFWRRKMRTFHRILDINKDGVVSFDDFKILVDRFVYLGHLTPQHQKEFNQVVQSMWEERWGTISPYNLVTTEQYLEDMFHIVNDKQLRKKVHNFLPYLFKVSEAGRLNSRLWTKIRMDTLLKKNLNYSTIASDFHQMLL